MKLNFFILEVVLANNSSEMSFEGAQNWKQPTYWEAMSQSSTDRWRPWGHPTEVRAAASWKLCPDLSLPDGVASLRCNGATCMAVCEIGKISMGRRRTKCRFKRSKGFFWGRELAPCQGCDPEIAHPAWDVDHVMMGDYLVGRCLVDEKMRKNCKIECPKGAKVSMLDSIMFQRKVALKCRCPRNDAGKKSCAWQIKRSSLTTEMVNSLKCNLPSCPENAQFSVPSGNQNCGEIENCQCVESGVSTYMCSNENDDVANSTAVETVVPFKKYDNCPPSRCVCDQGYCATSSSTHDNLECVKCSECPVASESQLQCPDNAIATECTCQSYNSCNLDMICNGNQLLLPSDTYWDEYEDMSCDGIQVECKCNEGFCRESGEFETIPTSRCIPCEIHNTIQCPPFE